MSNKCNYRIRLSDGTYLNAGTGLSSWFTLKQAYELVDYTAGEIIVEHDGENILWEVL
jgi:hypothetical protein